ncbi:35893_t:CDS:2, partial [Racocetra persica]
EEKEQEFLELLKIVELAEQIFGANHAKSKLANEINNWHLTPASVYKNIKQSCVEHGYRGRWNTLNYQVGEVVYIDIKECYPAIAVNEELLQDDITGFAQVRFFKFVPNIHLAISVWYRKHFACRTDILESVSIGEAIISLTKQTNVWLPKNQDISCAIIGKFTQRNKVEEKHLTHWVDCIKEGTYAASILAYAHINLLEMLRRFGPNEVLSKRLAISKFESVKVFQKTKMLLAVGEYFPCSKYKPFVCHDCFWDWYAHKGFWEVIPDKKPSSNTKWTPEHMGEKKFPQVDIWNE